MIRAICAICALLLLAPLVATAGDRDKRRDREVIEFDEFEPIVEINATDGDVGFHVLLDGDAWNVAKIYDSEWDRMLKALGTDDLDEQGVTEVFLESAEPLCWEDPEADEDEEIVTLEEFVDRFEAGAYHARGWTIEGDLLRADGDLTHNLPAAPEIAVTVELEDDDVEVEISWEPGEDLGKCAFPEGLIPDPAEVEVVRWEIVVEPSEDQLPDGVAFGVFSVQLPGDRREVEVPDDFIEAYLEAGVTEFKMEVGAKEESGNQTFTEEEFEIEL